MARTKRSWDTITKGTKGRKHEKNHRSVSAYDPFDDEGGGVEVKQKTDVQARRFQIRPQLGKVNVFKSPDCFELQNDLLLDNEVESVQSQVHSLKVDVRLFAVRT